MCKHKNRLILTQSGYTRAAEKLLTIPTVPDALADGLLPLTALDAPLEVNFPLWAAPSTAQNYQLRWDGDLIGIPVDIRQEDLDNPERELKLYLPQELLIEKNDPANPKNKQYVLEYRVVDNDSGEDNFSFPKPIEIDTTKPGLPSHGPMDFPRQVDDGLTSAELSDLGDQLDVVVTSYSTMAVGDFIQSFWGATPGPTATVGDDNMALEEVPLIFSRSFLESVEAQVGDSLQPVTYLVTDRAGNISDRSVARHIKLLLADAPDNLDAPIIEQASPEQGGLIDYNDAQAGVTVDIPLYLGGGQPGDMVTLFWGDNNPLPPVRVEAGEENNNPILSPVLQFDIINRFPEAMVNVHYEVRRSDGQLKGTSEKQPVQVHLTLPLPEGRLQPLTIQGTSDNPNREDNLIDPDDYELDARAIFRWVNGLRIGDRLHLHWGSQEVPDWHEISQEEFNAGVDIDIPVDNQVLKDHGTGHAIVVTYSLSRNSNPNPSQGQPQNVVVRSKMEQPGGEDGLPKPQFTRLAENGHISPGLNPDGTPVWIPPYQNIKLNHDVTLVFEGFDLSYRPIPEARFEKTETVNDTNISTGLTIQVPLVNLYRLCKGYGQITYRVTPIPEHNQEPANSETGEAPVSMDRPGAGCPEMPAT
ncbi:hypothetical protein [Pseudomonas vanderleydeniana]|uniref:Uncharacterized protein n=1 Tax=Pseudomonas vanderleydeniana TaxID=2745495 RepID=A0A9E6PIA1_9PSED|nr:hypothetical protein [Pseudomonas vanderleydeniana]QXI26915.1 hypothetical protein HU752_023765 [Pseudomonas vanderleydeniana]